ncbi:MAG: 4'-phosphopantetheinyl transferase EntD [Sulfitobacter sp.]|jgi:4'-phosphopantetheinyl transferase EntD
MIPMDSLDRCVQMYGAVAGMFPAGVEVAVVDPRAPQPGLLPAEAAHVAGAVAKRQQEFAAGRAAARLAMRRNDLAIPAGDDRAPIWPQGWHGSISHSDQFCVAVVTQAPLCLGVDLEEAVPLDQDLLTSICSPSEIAAIAGPDQLLLAKIVFSAKEAAYKVQYPLTGVLFGFDHLAVSLDWVGGAFTARFEKPAGQFCAGDQIDGHFALIGNHIVTTATFDHRTP